VPVMYRLLPHKSSNREEEAYVSEHA
jgi:hypothetical protein